MKTINGIKRLTIDLPQKDHFKLKTLASFEGISMKEYILKRALSDGKLSKKKAGKKDETTYLLASEKNRKRLLESLTSKKITRFNSIKELENALGL